MNALLTMVFVALVLVGLLFWQVDQSNDPAAGRASITARIDGSLDDLLRQTASEMNRKLPVMIDSGTRLDSTAGMERTFRYNYTLINHPASKVNEWKLQEAMNAIIVKRVCTSQEMKFFLNNGVEVSLAVYGNDGGQITVFSVPPSSCAS